MDGPRGPARVAQPGAVWLASATGNPLLIDREEVAQDLTRLERTEPGLIPVLRRRAAAWCRSRRW